jgi:molecular chaperone HscB
MVQCPSCARPQAPRLICSDCESPLACNLDYFAALDLPRKLQINGRTLEQAYHELGRRLHPDRFANASAAVREQSLRATALLTRAYRTMRDPVGRGRYWLELNGRKLADSNQQVPPELAGLVFATQEELAELRASSIPGASEITSVRERQAEVRGLLERLDRELEGNFEAFDRLETQASDEMFGQLKRILSDTAYLTTLMRDIERALDRKAAA